MTLIKPTDYKIAIVFGLTVELAGGPGRRADKRDAASSPESGITGNSRAASGEGGTMGKNRRTNCISGIAAITACLFAALVTGCASTAPSAPSAAELVWPRAPSPPRLTYVMSLSSEKELKNEATTMRDRLLGEKPKVRGPSLVKPYGVHADREGRVFVTDTALTKLVVFDLARQQVSVWGNDGPGFLRMPIGVTSDSAGGIYVTDSVARRVVIFDSAGGFVRQSSSEADFERPTGIAVDDKRGRIYVSDTGRHHIVVLDMKGAYLETIGGPGDGPGQFNYPTNLALDADGNLNVVDSLNHRIQIIGPDGAVISSFGQNGDTTGSFARPRGISIDSDGNIYVVDAAFNNFQIFDRQGQLLLYVGAAGLRPGEFQMPAGAFVDSQDRLYVVDQFNHRVQIFQYLKEPAGGAE